MIIIRGTSAFPGIAIGKILYYEREVQQNRRYRTEDVQEELQRFALARERVLRMLKEKKRDVSLEEEVLHSPSFLRSVEGMIRSEKVNAYYAVMINRNELVKNFSNLETPEIRARLSALRKISDQLMLTLGISQNLDLGEEPFILACAYLSPSELMEIDRDKLLGVVTHHGSLISYSNVIARNMEIPNLTDLEPNQDWNGRLAIVDGYTGCLCLDPEPEILNEYVIRQTVDRKEKEALLAYRDLPDLTADKQKFRIMASIGSIDDLHNALYYKAPGIGMFRSEFQYLGRDNYPSEDELFQVYRQAAEAMRGRLVVICTCDLGTDKKEPYMGLPEEPNPLMGNRGIRLCLDRKQMFCEQLRAVYRASAYGTIGIMFPMITSEEEMDEIEKLTKQVKQSLVEKELPFREIRTGILVETPAAVMISRELARRVDFLAVDTNDLTQHTLAMDRSNPALLIKYREQHPAVMRMIRIVVCAAHEEQKQVYICGELAADSTLTESFLRMGVDALSVVPACILPVRRALSEISMKEPDGEETV